MRQLGKQPSAPVSGAPCFEIAFVCDDVAAAVDCAVAAGACLVQAPEAMPWGQTVAYVADLEGFLVELGMPVGG